MSAHSRPRSRSRSPSSLTSASAPLRSRSRSPPRQPKNIGHKTSGLRWKEKPRKDEVTFDRDHGLMRGYRHNRDERRDWNKDEANAKDKAVPDATKVADGTKLTEPSTTVKNPEQQKKGKKDREKKAPLAPRSNEPMIIVNVNDRLGTKAAIPCLASDPIKLFKAQVAARIGRQPHEIMLKRQGERPMKDMLTLEDYGVSNGVQLDLELDTGD